MINVYDVSAYIYAGMGTDFGSRAKYKGIPTGGLYCLLRAICSAIKQKDIVVLVFDSQTNAQTILPEYKGGRSRDPKVRFQVDTAYELLKNAIPNCYKIQGYEADWIAATIFEEVAKEGRFSIAGYTVDADWAHSVINSNTILLPATKNAFYVTASNFQAIFSTEETVVPFNTISMYKVFYGDKSDNISPIFINSQYTNRDWFLIYTQFCSSKKLDNRLKETALQFVDFITKYINPKERQELLNRIEVIYPRIITEHKPLEISVIDPKSLVKILSLTGCKSLAKGLGINFIDDMGDLQEDLKTKYLEELGQTSKTRFFSNSNTQNIEIKDRGGFV